MALRCGIVGLPNVGKSTLFNALSAASVPAENYPFCTIEPNLAVVEVPDPRLEQLALRVPTQKVIPAQLQVVDIAGLVRGAHKGQGLGNQFLSHIRQVHTIVHVLRCFEDPNVAHVEGRVDPLQDKEILDLELQMKDLETVERRLPKAQKEAQARKDPKLRLEVQTLEKALSILQKAQNLRSSLWSLEEAEILHQLGLLTLKPVLYVANVEEASLPNGNAYSQQVQMMAQAEQAEVVVLCAALEAQMAMLAPSERAAFLAAYGLAEPALHILIRKAYALLGLQTFFTVGPKEIRAWTIRKGSLAPQAAGEIHSDFERGFIRAEVIKYDDLVQYGNEEAIRAAGKLFIQGKDYVVEDGDILHFRFSV